MPGAIQLSNKSLTFCNYTCLPIEHTRFLFWWFLKHNLTSFACLDFNLVDISRNSLHSRDWLFYVQIICLIYDLQTDLLLYEFVNLRNHFIWHKQDVKTSRKSTRSIPVSTWHSEIHLRVPVMYTILLILTEICFVGKPNCFQNFHAHPHVYVSVCSEPTAVTVCECLTFLK